MAKVLNSLFKIPKHSDWFPILNNIDHFPVKNVTWILMEIPCHFLSQIDGSLVKIHTNFHDNSMSFFQVLFVFHAKTWHGFYTSSSHGISMAFANKMTEFPSDLMSFPISDQTAVKKTWQNPCHIFYMEEIIYQISSFLQL